MLQQLDAALNSGQVTPDTLDLLLNLHGFQLTYQETTFNLFGDGLPAEVLWITLQSSPSTGLYSALRKNSQGRYSLEKIFSTWDYTLGWDGGREETVFQIKDHTGDGIPEVVLHPSAQSGSLCSYDLYLFQWKTDRFVDLTQSQLHFGIGCGVEGTYDFGSPDARGVQPIETVRDDYTGSRVNIYRKYEWNGEAYVLTENRLEPPLESDQGSYNWLQSAMYRGDYDRVIQYLSPATLATIGDAGLGASYPDYLRFQLGLAYAFLFDKGDAQSNFKQVAEHPVNHSVTALRNAAQAFLDHYTGHADLYKACQAALMVMNATSSPRAWGFAGEMGGGDDVCRLDKAFQAVASHLSALDFLKAPSFLEQSGVKIRTSLEADLNEDGQAEWIVWADTPGTAGFSDSSTNLWVLTKTSGGIKSFIVNTPDASEARSLKVKTVTTPDGKIIVFIEAGSALSLFRLNAEEETVEDETRWYQGVESYSVYQGQGGLMLEVTATSNDCVHCKTLYRWSSQEGKFSDASYPDESKVIAAEAALLQEWDPISAIPLLWGITAYPDYSVDAARTLYLLGLAYELNGDSTKAVQAYWQCWSAHPDSIYARLAQAKLELRK